MTNKLMASVAFVTALVAGAAVPLGGAQAITVYTENFNAGFQGTDLALLPLSDRSSDKYALTDYYTILNAGGWSFSSGAYFALGTIPAGGTDGAVLVNENGGSALNVVGLASSTSYQLSFLVYGDNRAPGVKPPQTGIWGLHVDVNGSTRDLTGTDQTPGTNPGTIETLFFSSNVAGTATLFFNQTTPGGSEASAIIDNVQISTVEGGAPGQTPLPAALPLFATGLGAFGLLGWRRKRKNAAAA